MKFADFVCQGAIMWDLFIVPTHPLVHSRKPSYRTVYSVHCTQIYYLISIGANFCFFKFSKSLFPL